MNKRNKVILILSIIFIVLAVAFIVLGFVLSGANILAWFGSKWAMWFYAFAGIYALVVIAFVVSERIKRL